MLTCRRAGTVQIEGVSWLVFDTVRGYHQFNLPPERVLQRKPGSGAAPQLIIKPNMALTVPVAGRMPHAVFSVRSTVPAELYGAGRAGAPELKGSSDAAMEVNAFPCDMLQGECQRVLIRLENSGAVPLVNAVLRVSHPGMHAHILYVDLLDEAYASFTPVLL